MTLFTTRAKLAGVSINLLLGTYAAATKNAKVVSSVFFVCLFFQKVQTRGTLSSITVTKRARTFAPWSTSMFCQREANCTF